MFKKILCIGLLAAAFQAPAHATVINATADGSWNTFDVDSLTSLSSGLEWISLDDGSALSFSLTLTGNGLLTVVDGGFAGDRFKIFDNGILLGETSATKNSFPSSIGLDFDAALNNPKYSHASFILGAGLHKITGLLSQSALDAAGAPIDATVGALSIVSVAEPATGALILFGAALLVSFVRRRNV